jgi:small subunit ribosomal protein S20
MTHSLSAAKRHRQSLKRRDRNRARVSTARTSLKRARVAIASGSEEESAAAIREAASVLDRTAQKGSLHPNTAARYKSRLARAQNKALSGEAVEAAPKKRSRAASGTKKTAARSRKKS